MHNTSLAKMEYYFHVVAYCALIFLFLREFLTKLFDTTEASTLADFTIYLLLFFVNFVARALAKHDMKKELFLKITNKGVYLYLEFGEHIFIPWDSLEYLVPKNHSFFKENYVVTFTDVSKIKGLDQLDEKRLNAITKYKKMYLTRKKFFDSYSHKITEIYLSIAFKYAPEYIERIQYEMDKQKMI